MKKAAAPMCTKGPEGEDGRADLPVSVQDMQAEIDALPPGVCMPVRKMEIGTCTWRMPCKSPISLLK